MLYFKKFRFLVIVILFPFVNIYGNNLKFNFATITGEKLSEVNLKNKIVLINFWGTWCSPCVQELPLLEQLYQTYKSPDLIFLGIAEDSKSEKIAEFMEKFKVHYFIVQDQSDYFADFFAVSVMPTTFLINMKGEVVLRIEGFSKEGIESIDEMLKQLMKNKFKNE